MLLSEIWCYPVKSLRGVRLGAAELDRRGIALDRHWMLVDRAGRFLSQRREPRMALVRTALDHECLTLDAPGISPLVVPIEHAEAPCRVEVWHDRLDANAVGEDADRWLSTFLGLPCRLVVMPASTRRPVGSLEDGVRFEVGFADAFPLLLLCESSLADLGARVGRELPIERFRPNLVVRGAAPYAEDGWQRIRIGEISLRVVKPCSRCAITTVDPERGERDGSEPLQTLATYRRRGNDVFLGQNLVHERQGRLEVGMAVEVLETGPPPSFDADER